MEISLVICTFNRSINLRNTLNSISGLSIPNNLNWEIIIVDNNSNDDTKSVIKSFQK